MSSSPSQPRLYDITKAHGAVVLGQDAVALNDDLVHLAVVVAEDGGHVPAILIKDLDGNDSDGIVIEYAYVQTFIQTIQAQLGKLQAMTAELDALYEETHGPIAP